MEQSPFCEHENSSASEDNRLILCNTKIHCRAKKPTRRCPETDSSILRQYLIPKHQFQYYRHIYVYVLKVAIFPSGFPTEILYAIPLSPIAKHAPNISFYLTFSYPK